MGKGTAGYKFLILSCRATVKLLPERALYGGGRRFIFVMLYRIVRYRLKVVRANLSNSFPEKSVAELRAIEKEFYLHLAEVFVDTISMAAISDSDILKRFHIDGLQEHERRVEGRDWIAAMSHYGSWEYFSAYQLLTRTQVAGVYHPLVNKALDRFYLDIRARFGMQPVAMNSLLRYINVNKGEEGRRPIAIGMIADQGPLWFDIKKWYNFLNQNTAFLEGPERIAVKFGMPVYFLELQKTGTARYRGRFVEIYDGQSAINPSQIVERYAALLQQQIRSQPAYWMWSHRRWKRQPREKVTIHELPAFDATD